MIESTVNVGNATLSRCTFRANIGNALQTAGAVTLDHCIVSATTVGEAIYCRDDGTVTLLGCDGA